MENEQYLTLSQAAALLPGKPHISTMHRWRLRGVRGVKLRTQLIGGRRYTKPQWLDEFFEALDDNDSAPSAKTSLSSVRTAQIKAAEVELSEKPRDSKANP